MRDFPRLTSDLVIEIAQFRKDRNQNNFVEIAYEIKF